MLFQPGLISNNPAISVPWPGRGQVGVGKFNLDQESLDYFRARERVEREAAKAAASEAVRRAHLQLAEGYAALVKKG